MSYYPALMLALPKKTDYALIALYYLMEHPARVASAREIAEMFNLPCALLMNVMKELQRGGMVRSVRGANGGYQLAVDPGKATLYEVVQLTSGEPVLTECCQSGVVSGAVGTTCQVGEASGRGCPVQEPLRRLHVRLMTFLKDVKLADLLKRPIDVPSEMVGIVS